MDMNDIENVQNSQTSLKYSGLKSHDKQLIKSPSSRAKSPRRGSSGKILSVLDDLESLQSDLRKSSNKKKRSASKIAVQTSTETPDISMNLDTLLGAAETSPLIELDAVKYRPSIGGSDTEGIYPPSKRLSRSSKKNTDKNNRRETFVGGSDEVELILRGGSDDEGDALGDVVFDTGGKKDTRRETCDAADMEAMLQNLQDDDDDDDVEDESCSDPSAVARNLSVSVLSEYEESPCALASPYSNLLSMSTASHSSQQSASSHRSGRFVNSSSLSTTNDDNETATTSPRDNVSGNVLNDIVFDSGSKKDSRRMTVDSTDMADMLDNLDDVSSSSVGDSSFRSIKSSGRKSVNRRRQTCDAGDMEDMLLALEEENDIDDSCTADVSVEATTLKRVGRPSGSGSGKKRSAPKSPSKSVSKSNSAAKSKSSRRDTFVGGSEAVEILLIDDKDDEASTSGDIVFECDKRNTRRETCDAEDMEAMLLDLENNDVSTTSTNTEFSSHSRMDPKLRDIIVHDELNLTSSSANYSCSSPVKSATPVDLPMRRSPRLSRSARGEESSVDIPKIKSSRRSISKSGTDVNISSRRDTFVGGAAAIEQMLVDDEEEESHLDERKKARNDRRQTAEAGDIEKIMRELEEEEAQTKNILGHKALSTSTSRLDEDKSRQGIDFSPCPGSRESVDTLVLMNSVAALLEKAEADDDEGSPPEKTNLDFDENDQATSPVQSEGRVSGSPSPLLNMSTSTTGGGSRHQQAWNDMSVDDYTMDGGSIEDSHLEDDAEGDISNGTVNTLDLLSSVRHLVKKSAPHETDPTSSSYQNISVQSDLSNETSFLSHDERRDSFDDHTVSTMGSLRSFLMEEDDVDATNTSASSPATSATKRGARSPTRTATPDSLHALVKPAGVHSAAFDSPPEETGHSTVPVQGLKSCLSSRKKPRNNQKVSLSSVTASAKKRGVVFGSPTAAEFNKTSPTTNFTPMHNHEAKSLFSMAGNSTMDDEEDNDEVTNENSAILDEWDRLTNTSMDGSDEENPASPTGASGSKVLQRGNGRRATIGGAATPKDTLSSPSDKKKRRQSVQASLPILQNSASLKRNRRRKSRLHISDSDVQLFSGDDDESMSNFTDASGLDTSGEAEASRTEILPGNLEELMQQRDLNPSPAASTCSSVESSAAPALNTLVRSAALNASMSMASLNDSMTDRTQTLEQDLNALMRRVDQSGMKGSLFYRKNDDSVLDENEDESQDNSRLSGSSMQSSVAAGGLGALLDSEDQEDAGDEEDDAPARLRQIAESSSPTSSSDNSMVSMENDEEVTVDSVVSFKKRGRRISGARSADSSIASISKQSNRGDVCENNVSVSQEFTQELELNLDTMMQTVIQDAVNKPSTMDDTDADVSMLTTSVMNDENYEEESSVDADTVLEEDVQIIDEGDEENVISFGRNRGKSLIGQGECDISVISKSLNSSNDSTSTVADDIDTFSAQDNNALGVSSYSIDMAGPSAPASETPNMLRKLRGLNAVSRRQSLNQAAHTPLAAAASRMSGMKRVSLTSQQLESTTKRMAQRFEQKFCGSSIKDTSQLSRTPQQSSANDSTTFIQSFVKNSSVLNVSHINSESYRDEKLQEFLTRLTLNSTSIHTDSLFDLLTNFSESYTTENNNFPLMDPKNQAVFRSEVQSILSEVLCTATEETAENATLMEGDMINKWHCMEESRYTMVVDALKTKNTEDSSSSLMQLRDLAEQNVALSSSKWKSWEVDLMQVAMEAVTSKKLSIRDENQLLEQELVTISDENADKAATSVEALQERLAQLQIQLTAAREEVSSKKDHLQDLQDQCSATLMEKKNYLVELASESLGATSNDESSSSIDQANVDSTIIQDDVSNADNLLLEETKEAVAELQFRLNIINKITYCRIIAYKSNQIKARVHLTKNISFDLTFNLKMQMVDAMSAPSLHNRKISNAHKVQRRSLCVEKVTVQPSFDVNGPLDSFADSESMLAVAFFWDFLASEARGGPVSVKHLSSLDQVTDIPQCLQQVSGYVSSLRDVMTWLSHMHLSPEKGASSTSTRGTNWIWGITEDSATVRNYTVFLEHSSEARVDIPLAALVSGDMELVPSQFFRGQEPQSPGGVAVQKKLNVIASRCASPFGSFPVGQIMHAIAPH